MFGPLEIEWHSFVNCGVKHDQDPNTKEITLDQDHYIKGIKTIPVTDYQSLGETDKCNDKLHTLYWSIWEPWLMPN